MADMTVAIGTMQLNNPVILASGTAGYGTELTGFFSVKNVGAITLKALSLSKRVGNPPPRVTETALGVMNAIGLANEGYDYFKEHTVPALSKVQTTLVANLVGEKAEDYVALCKKLNSIEEIRAYELNVSCPNVKAKGRVFSDNMTVLRALVTECKKVSKRPVIVKLPPYVFSIEKVARAVEKAGADAISLINTVPSLEIDVARERPVLGNNFGGLSGPAILPVALRLVYLAANAVTIPVIGGGGITTGEDAAKFLLAGATAVSVGTATMVTPDAGARIAKELAAIVKAKKLSSVSDLIGRLTLNEK